MALIRMSRVLFSASANWRKAKGKRLTAEAQLDCLSRRL